MRYICSVCGYVYDEAKEGVAFSRLPDSWRCPVCKAGKSVFKAEKQQEPAASQTVGDEIQNDMTELTAGEMAAVCSNLARGCEKQYNNEAAALYRDIAAYFTAAMPEEKEATIEKLERLLQRELSELYPKFSAVSKENGDRGAQRVCVWGEKVTNMLLSLVSQYREMGESLLTGKKVWLCTVCGFMFVGDRPPEICPVCKVPDWKFTEVEGRKQK